MTAPRRRSGRTAACTALAALFLGAAALAAPQTAFATTSDESNLSVSITDGSTPTPMPSNPVSGGETTPPVSGGSTPGVGARGSSGGAGAGGSTGGVVPAGSDTPVTDETSVGGMLFVGGLNSSTSLSPDPGEGTVTLWFTVRNASTATVDATAKFWMNSVLFDVPLDTVDGVQVNALAPGEIRVVSTQLHHGGQWTLINAHMTMTPPDVVDGVSLTPVTLDATVFLFPWLVALLLVILVTVIALVPRLIRTWQAATPAVSGA